MEIQAEPFRSRIPLTQLIVFDTAPSFVIGVLKLDGK